MDAKSTLQSLPMFEGLSEAEIESFDGDLRRMRLKPDSLLFSEGDPGESCYIIVSGSIVVLKALESGSERLAELRPGALVGHLSLIDRKPRSASCVSGSEGAVLLGLGRQDFERLFQANSPLTYKLLDRIALDLVARLRAATRHLHVIGYRGVSSPYETTLEPK